MQDIIIVGASGFGRETLSIINKINRVEEQWNVLGFIDDNPSALDKYGMHDKMLGSIQQWEPTDAEQYVLAIAAPKIKEVVVDELKKRGAKFASIIATSAAIGEGSIVGEGIVMYGNTIIGVNVRVGDFVFMDTMSIIGHDAIVGDFSTLGPKVSVSGATKVGKCVNFGALATTYPGITIGDYATVGMNSCAIRKVKPHTTVIGVPAKIM